MILLVLLLLLLFLEHLLNLLFYELRILNGKVYLHDDHDNEKRKENVDYPGYDLLNTQAGTWFRVII